MNVIRVKLAVLHENVELAISTCIVYAGIQNTIVTVDEHAQTIVTCEIHENAAAANELYLQLLSMHTKRKFDTGSRVSWMKPTLPNCILAVGGIAIVECGFIVI